MNAAEEAEVKQEIARIGKLGFIAGALTAGTLAVLAWVVICA